MPRACEWERGFTRSQDRAPAPPPTDVMRRTPAPVQAGIMAGTPSMREEENFMRYLFGAVLCVAGAWLMVRSAKKLGEYPAYPVMR